MTFSSSSAFRNRSVSNETARANAWQFAFDRLTPAQRTAWDGLDRKTKEALYRLSAAELIAHLDAIAR